MPSTRFILRVLSVTLVALVIVGCNGAPRRSVGLLGSLRGRAGRPPIELDHPVRF
jgi:hypothetical protein